MKVCSIRTDMSIVNLEPMREEDNPCLLKVGFSKTKGDAIQKSGQTLLTSRVRELGVYSPLVMTAVPLMENDG